MTTLPPRNSPTWKEAISHTAVGCRVRNIPSNNSTILHAIEPGDTFWIDDTVVIGSGGFMWHAVKTVTVVGWCASPPLLYTFVAPSHDTVPPLVSPFLTADELNQMHNLFSALAALTAKALERATQ